VLSAGAASFATEYTTKFLETLQQQGVDIEDPQTLASILTDPAKTKAAKEKAVAKGVPVAVFDTLSAAMSFGIGSKVASGVVRGGAVKALEKTAEGGVKEIAKQIVRPMTGKEALGLTGLSFAGDVAFGMAGEALGQRYSEGQVTDVPGVVAEGLAELAPGLFEFGSGAIKGIVSPTFTPTTKDNLRAQQALQNIENRRVLSESEKLLASGAPQTAKAVAGQDIQMAVASIAEPTNEPKAGEIGGVSDNPEQSLILLNELSGKIQKGETPLLTDETQKQTFQKLVQTAPDKFRFESGPEGVKVLEVPGAAQVPAPTAPTPQPAAPQKGAEAVAPALETVVPQIEQTQRVLPEIKPIAVTEGDFTFNFKPEDLQTYYGDQFSPQTEQDLKDLGTALAINLSSAYKALGSAARNRALTFNTIKTVQTSTGGGLYANPVSEGDFNTLYVDPQRLLGKLKSLEQKSGTAAVSQYLTDALAEEALHVQDGASLYSNYAAKTPRGEELRTRFGNFSDYYKSFFSKVTEEMTDADVNDALGAYLGRRWSNLPTDRKEAALKDRQLLSRIVGMQPWQIGAEFSRQLAQEGYGRKTENLWNRPKPFLLSLLTLYRRYYDKLVGKIPAGEARKAGVELVAKRFKNLNELLNQAPEDMKRMVAQGDFLNSFDPSVFAEEEGRIEAEKTAFETDTLARANRWLSDDPSVGYRNYAIKLTNDMAPGMRSKKSYEGSITQGGEKQPLDEIQVDALTELSRLASQYDPNSKPEGVDPRQHEMAFIRSGISNYLLARKRSAGERAARNLSLDIPLPTGTRAAGRGVVPVFEQPQAEETEKGMGKRRMEAMRDKQKATELKDIRTEEVASELAQEETEDTAGADDIVGAVEAEVPETDTEEDAGTTGLGEEVEKQGKAMATATAQDNPAEDAANDPVYDNEGKGPQFVGDTAVDEESSTEAEVKRRERDSLVGMVLDQMDPKLRSVYDIELEAIAENPGASRDAMDKYGAKKLGITEDEYAELRQETFKNFRAKALSGRVFKEDLVGSPDPDDVIGDLSTEDSFRKGLRKWFSSRGLLPQALFDTWVKAKQSEAGEYYQARQNAEAVRGLLNKLKKQGGDVEGARNLINTVLANPNEGMKLKARETLLQISPELHDLTIEMRDHIDRLSMDLANLLHVPEKLKATVLANLRTYLNRSYEIFDNPAWAKNLVEAINAPADSKIVNSNAQQIINAARVWAANDLRTTRAKRDSLRSLRKENQLRRLLGKARYQDEWVAKFNELNPNAKIDTSTKEGKQAADKRYRESADYKARVAANYNAQKAVTEGEANRYLTAIIDQYRQPDIQALVRGKGNVFRKNLDILKTRESIPEELRKLLGEYTDPDAVYFRTAQKLSTFLAKDSFLSDFAELGKGVFDDNGVQISQKFLYDKESELPASGDFVKFRAENPAYAPLDGKWMPRELADVLADHFKPEEVGEKWFGIFRKVTGLAMLAKTGYSFQATIRNFLGNVMQPVSNGHVFRPSSYKNAFLNTGVLKEAVTRSDNPIVESLRRKASDQKAWSAEIKKLISYGIIGENVDANLIKEFLQQDTFISSGEKFLGLPARKWGLVAKGFKEFNQLINRNYASVDHFWKVLFFEAEKARYSEIFKGAPEEAIEDYAAKMVRDTTFTYSMAPKAIRVLSKTGVLAPFVRFSSEVIRTVANQLQTAKNEISGDTSNVPSSLLKYVDRSALKRSGWQRSLGLATTFFLIPSAFGAVGMALGVDPDDEDKIRRFLPSYWKNAQLAVFGKDGKGEYKYMNMSFINPYAYFAEVKNAMFATDGDISDKVASAIGAAFRPFVSEQLVVGAIMDVLRNRTSDGKEIFNPMDPDKPLKIAGHLLQPFNPGTVQSLGRILEGYKGEVRDSGYAPDFRDELISSFMGLKINRNNISEGWDRKVRGFKKMESDTEQMFTKVLGSKGTVTPERLVESYQNMEEARYQLWQEFRADYEAARGLGLSLGQAVSLLKVNKVPEDTIRAVVAGRYIPYQASRVALQNAIRYPGGRERLVTYLSKVTAEASKRNRLVTTKLPN